MVPFACLNQLNPLSIARESATYLATVKINYFFSQILLQLQQLVHGLSIIETLTFKYLIVDMSLKQARGLDVVPSTISRFRNVGDERTAELLETVVYPEEITHCAAGVKWFRYLCLRDFGKHTNAALGCLCSENPVIEEGLLKQQPTHEDDESVKCQEQIEKSSSDEDALVIPTFHATVRRYFRGPLKPPFNEHARKAAGFKPDWYEPLATKEQQNVK